MITASGAYASNLPVLSHAWVIKVGARTKIGILPGSKDRSLRGIPTGANESVPDYLHRSWA